MTKEELEKALRKAWQMGQNYQSLADSEYTSHWKKADVVREQFNQLVEEAVGKVQEQPEQECGYDETTGNCTKENCCRAQPEQEPVAMKFKIYKPTVPDPTRQDINNALLPWVYDQDRSSGFEASMWVTPVATLPPQRKPLTDEVVNKLVDDEDWYNDPHSFVRAIEAAHGIKGEA